MLYPAIIGAGVLALILAGGRRKKAPGPRPATPPGAPPTPRPTTGETIEQGEARLAAILVPWLNSNCLQHIMASGNDEGVAQSYVALLGNELIARYRERAKRMSVAAAVEETRIESGAMCGTWLPPNWIEAAPGVFAPAG